MKTDPLASPTGFPFKVLNLDGTLADSQTYEDRNRVCDLAYLRQAYMLPDGSLGWRCAAEPVADYERKGGTVQDTSERKCICNALMANIGLGQIRRDGASEFPLVTSGNDVVGIERFLSTTTNSYTAKDVIQHLLSGVPTPTPVHA